MIEQEDVDNRDLEEMLRYVDEAIGETRSLTSQLSPPVLQQLGFAAALEWLSDEFSERHGIPVRYTADDEPEALREEVAVTLFQATRELITNAIKHANPGQVTVRSWVKDGSVCIEVEDDGIGLDTGAVTAGKHGSGGFGLFNVQERISYLGGNVDIDAAPDEGTRITLICPIAARETERS